MKRKTYGSLTYAADTGEWVVEHIPPHVALRLKQIFTKISPSQTAPYRLKATAINAADIQWFMERYPLECSLGDRRLLNRHAKGFYEHQSASEAILLPDWKPTERPGLKPGSAFRGYQRTALDFTEMVKRLILLDDVGLGKTYEGLGLALLKGALPLVIVCQPHLQEQWYKKARQFIDLRVEKVNGTRPYDLPEADIYLVKYSQLSGWVDVLSAGWVRAIAFDEIQELRHGKTTKKGEAAHQICQALHLIDGYTVGLTATLIYNYGIESYNIVNMLQPGLLGTREEFLREWCENDATGKGVVKNPDALGAFLQESMVVLRRTKRDVGQEAKQLAPEMEWVDPDTDAVDDNEALAEQLALKTLTASFKESGAAAREFDLKLRQLTGIAKAKAVSGFVRMVVESGQPVVLFAWHREVYDILLRELADLKPAMYTGSEGAAQKEANKQAFIDGETDLLIMSLRSGAGADDLQYRSSTVIFAELDHSPLIHHQCIGRLDRDGQLDPVYVYYLVTAFGSDPVMIDNLGLKQTQSDGIVDPGQTKDERQADPDRIKRMAREYLKARGVEVPGIEESEEEDQLALL